ncbi:MAG: AAA family ATPase [Mollicutes bacterium PWAP]|nr:AAA family ATPase [Mollicutes bacterium PWAP]
MNKKFNKDLSNLARPKTMNDVIGQNHIKEFFKRMTKSEKFFSIILYGKPGIGKTSIAYAILNDMKLNYAYFNAATNNKKDLIEIIELNEAIIIDECHRLNKDKQDILLPLLENGKIKIIGTTTENPFFVINPAIRSRLTVIQLYELTNHELFLGLKKTIKNFNLDVNISDYFIKKIAKQSNGDFRHATKILDQLDTFFRGTKINGDILKIVKSFSFYSDRSGDGHYDLLSAFHKSLRGSDVNASLYYLGRLIKSGDIIGMERRILMVATEDVSLADPNIILRIKILLDTAKQVGFPEANIVLSNAVIQLAKAEKSNTAYKSISNVMNLIENGGIYPIPKHIKDSHYKNAYKLNNGIGYKYPHDYKNAQVKQQYLPNEIEDKVFFLPNERDKIK